MECRYQQKEIVMLILTRRPGESLVFTFPDDLDLEPITIITLQDRRIGIEAPDEVEIVRSELLDSSF
jgi:carbon storage regulator CsrA